MFFGTTNLCLDSDCFSCVKSWIHAHSTIGIYDRQVERLASEIWVDLKKFKSSTGQNPPFGFFTLLTSVQYY